MKHLPIEGLQKSIIRMIAAAHALETIYPSDNFTGESGDIGPVCIRNMREAAKDAQEQLKAYQDTGGLTVHDVKLIREVVGYMEASMQSEIATCGKIRTKASLTPEEVGDMLNTVVKNTKEVFIPKKCEI